MKRADKIVWMHKWAAENGFTLDLEGTCGFGRECVGILAEDKYPDYAWYDENFTRIDNNGEVWRPEDAYHKHECVAVLGRGEKAESQLYDWLQWFDRHGFKIEVGDNKVDPRFPTQIAIMMGKHRYARMVKPAEPAPLDDGGKGE